MRRHRILAPVVTLTLAAGLLVPGLASAGAPPDVRRDSGGQPAVTAAVQGGGTGKGPVGWDQYRQLDRAGELRSGAQSRQFSSFDRTGGNNDGFNGEFSCLRTDADGGCVIAEGAGAGELQSIWFTRFGPTGGGDVTDTGQIRIELDGRTVLDAKAQDVVTGKLGAPFAWPLVGNGDDTAGGVVMKVPMPYRESMRITVQHNPLFYHVSYRTFDDATGVRTFDPADKATDVLAMLRGFGVRDPKPAEPGTRTRSSAVDVPAGGTAELARIDGPGRIGMVRLQLPQLVRSPRAGDDGRTHQGTSSFTATVARGNDRVRITKRYDPATAGQRATLLVDGQPAGTWDSGAAGPAGAWADQTLEIPAALTRGKTKVTISHVYTGSGPAVSEYRYDVRSRVDGQWTRTDVLDVGPAHPGEEQAHGYAVTEQRFQGSKTLRYPVDAAALTRSDEVLTQARLRISFDGRPTVDAPLGEFFGSGLGEYDVRSQFFAIDAGPDGWYTAWWPMPFAEQAKVELVNASGEPISGGRFEVASVADRSAGIRLERGEVGYFHATARRADTTTGRDWTFLDAQGSGLFYGVTHSMRGLIPAGNRRNYLEGDERVYVDGALSPAWYGTGSEDFYESGWYFRDGTTYVMPTAGNPAYELDGDGCRYDCTGAYRLLVGDAIPFGSGLRFGIEHGPAANEPGDYSSTAYWYGHDRYTLRRTDALDVGDAADRQRHGYPEPAALTPLTSTYEGEDDDLPVTGRTHASTAPVSFRLAVDKANRGVRLTRLGDQAESHQAADVYVDGRPAGRWLQPLGNARSRWLEDTFDLPASVTRGKSRLDVRLVPVTGAPAWSAAAYGAVSRVGPFTDRSAPEQVGGLAARGDETNSVTLSWSAADDDTGVAAYEVYASKDPSVPVGADTLVGRTPVPAYRHKGLQLRETWHYRVRAVDGAGHAGPASGPVSATSGSTLEIEAESLLPPVSADAPVEPQGNCCGVVWSGNQQLWFRAAKAGDAMTVAVDVPVAGTYDLSAVWTQAPDYGQTQVSVDGTAVGTAFDGYFAGGVRIVPGDIGTVDLAQGRHQLTLTVTGKNAASTAYLAGLDLVRLRLR